MLIDCDRCLARPAACGDCVVGILLGTPEVPAATPAPAVGVAREPAREPAGPGDPLPEGFGPVEHRALEVLAEHGLIPRLRLVQVAPGRDDAVSSEGPRAAPRSASARGGRRARDVG